MDLWIIIIIILFYDSYSHVGFNALYHQHLK